MQRQTFTHHSFTSAFDELFAREMSSTQPIVETDRRTKAWIFSRSLMGKPCRKLLEDRGGYYLLCLGVSGFRKSELLLEARDGWLRVRGISRTKKRQGFLEVVVLPLDANVRGACAIYHRAKLGIWVPKRDILSLARPAAIA